MYGTWQERTREPTEGARQHQSVVFGGSLPRCLSAKQLFHASCMMRRFDQVIGA